MNSEKYCFIKVESKDLKRPKGRAGLIEGIRT